MKEDKEIQHVIGFSVSDIEELPIGPARYIRTFRIRTLLGNELVLTLRSESRLGLVLEAERDGPVIPKQKLRRRKDDRERKPEH
ncbi:MAG TPA: hypothetical protein VFB01_15430 [Burkholderiales bacterium]|nr:hypothetical protein [Burkholderiales bacterium]